MRSAFMMLLVFAMPASLLAQPPAPPEVTEHHKLLQRDVGVWDGVMKMWMAPDQEPQVVPLVETNSMLPGDLWLISEFDCGPFQGRAQIGYDTSKEKYVGTWIDNMSTYQGIMEGSLNDDGEMVMHSLGKNMTTGAPEKTKAITKWIGEETREFKMFSKAEGEQEWRKVFEITYTRRRQE